MSSHHPVPRFLYPPKPVAGNKVAVLSPSAGLPGRFPLPFELGLSRLRESFGLVPVEYLLIQQGQEPGR